MLVVSDDGYRRTGTGVVTEVHTCRIGPRNDRSRTTRLGISWVSSGLKERRRGGDGSRRCSGTWGPLVLDRLFRNGRVGVRQIKSEQETNEKKGRKIRTRQKFTPEVKRTTDDRDTKGKRQQKNKKEYPYGVGKLEVERLET